MKGQISDWYQEDLIPKQDEKIWLFQQLLASEEVFPSVECVKIYFMVNRLIWFKQLQAE
jgi:hypothetical protein